MVPTPLSLRGAVAGWLGGWVGSAVGGGAVRSTVGCGAEVKVGSVAGGDVDVLAGAMGLEEVVAAGGRVGARVFAGIVCAGIGWTTVG